MTPAYPIWQGKELGQQYLQGVRGAIPFATEQIELILWLVQRMVPQVGRFLDLGCGDGVLGRALFRRFPQAHGVFLDFSSTMIEAAQQHLGENRNATLLNQDYATPAWTGAVRPHAPFEVIVSGFSIHHQPDERKRALYQELFDLLAPGGLFLNLEHVASSTRRIESDFDEYFIDALCRYHQGRGTAQTREQIAKDYYDRPDKAANILALVEEQCGWLRNIGYQDVDCYFKVFELALFGGRRGRAIK